MSTMKASNQQMNVKINNEYKINNIKCTKMEENNKINHKQSTINSPNKHSAPEILFFQTFKSIGDNLKKLYLTIESILKN